jgi:hypothetical protein
MKKYLTFLIFFASINFVLAQQCPGGGTDFASSVTFSESWISGCLTGTSCNGGIEFDNRSSCEPTTAMDGCAPAPSCTNNAQDGSDIWFNFYATSTTAVINVIQNVSFVACIQAFSGGPACGSLVEIGCAKAAGPSSGVTLTLSGLTVGQLYYYRVFGSASAASQRTGTYCFCGSSGLGSFVLPVVLTSFTATTDKDNVLLKWTTASETNNRFFEIEHSTDGVNFSLLNRVAGRGTTTAASSYSYLHSQVPAGRHYYRLKQTDADGRFSYSEIITAMVAKNNLLLLYPVPANDELVIEADEPMQLALYNSAGKLMKHISISTGKNHVQVATLPPGVYLLRSNSHPAPWKFCISR